MKQRLYVGGVIGGVALVLVLLALLWQFGFDDPSPPSLVKNPVPAIPGTIAWVDKEQCIRWRAASGEGAETKHCPATNYIADLSWRDAGTVTFLDGSAGQVWVDLDIATLKERRGQPQDRGSYPAPPIAPNQAVSSRGERVFVGRGGEVFIVQEDGTKTEIFDASGDPDEGPRVDLAAWAPGGDWLLLRYWKDNELWLLGRDGKVARTLTGSAAGAVSWFVPGVGVEPKIALP